MPTESIPTWNDTCAPKRMRLSVSRPSSSVPSRCAELGGRSRSVSTCFVGLYGASNGADTAMSTNDATMARPTQPKCVREKRRQNIRTPLVSSCALDSSCGTAMSGCRMIERPPAIVLSMVAIFHVLSIMNPRIVERIQHRDNDNANHAQERHEQHYPLDERKTPLEDRRDHQPADSR